MSHVLKNFYVGAGFISTIALVLIGVGFMLSTFPIVTIGIMLALLALGASYVVGDIVRNQLDNKKVY